MSNVTPMKPQRIAPKPGQESVWDYPRPPRIERVTCSLRVEHAGHILADAANGWKILETSHPPVYYLPPETIAPGMLVSNGRASFCEFKGTATYYDLVDAGTIVAHDVAWTYSLPARDYAQLAHHVAFYANRVDACYVGDERVAAQAGDFYGGWITAQIVGPFKGAAGTRGW